MESKRIEEKNRIWCRINEVKKCIEIDTNTIVRFEHMPASGYTTTQIMKLKAKNDQHTCMLQDLEQTLVDLDRGLLDDDIQKEVDRVKQEIDRKTNETKKRKQRIVVNQENKQNTWVYHQSVGSRLREMDRSYKYFMRICESVPDYMHKKLKNMPNNKGYIWRGMHCYGELHADVGQPTSIFEKNKDLLIIHEWTNNDYKIWHKKGQGRKSLYKTYPRKKQGRLMNLV